MKRISFLVACMLFCLYATAQVDVNNVFTAMPPKNATSLTSEQLQTYLRSHFKVTLVPGNHETTYLADGVIVCFWDLKANPQYLKPLDSLQARGVRGVSKSATLNDSHFETVNSVRFGVYEFQKEDEVYIRFGSEVNKNLQSMNGILQFKAADKDKAHQYLKDLLASMRFKE